MSDDAVRIPKDPEARARLAQMAGLTEEERLALDQWCDEQAREDDARRRRGLEALGDTPMGDIGRTQDITPRGRGGTWCGIGVERMKREVNLGTLYRSAVALGADFIFTIGHRYQRTAADTIGAAWHIPCFSYTDLDDFNQHRPYSAPLVGVELADAAKPLEQFHHPRQALYLLGPEDGSLSRRAQEMCQHVVSFDSRYCLNVASAGTVVLYDRHVKGWLEASTDVGNRLVSTTANGSRGDQG